MTARAQHGRRRLTPPESGGDHVAGRASRRADAPRPRVGPRDADPAVPVLPGEVPAGLQRGVPPVRAAGTAATHLHRGLPSEPAHARDQPRGLSAESQFGNEESRAPTSPALSTFRNAYRTGAAPDATTSGWIGLRQKSG